MFNTFIKVQNNQMPTEHKFLQETVKPKNMNPKKIQVSSQGKQVLPESTLFLSLEKLSTRFQETPSTSSLTSKNDKVSSEANGGGSLEINEKPSISIEIPAEVSLCVRNIEQSTFLNFKTERGALNYRVPKELEALSKQTATLQKLQIFCASAKNMMIFNTCLRSIYQILIGVTQGYKKKLKIVGVGYKAFVEEKNLKIDLGFSHLKYYTLNSTLQTKFGRKNKRLHVSGTSLPLVAETAASVHSFKKPDVYKGKGIRYRGVKLTKKEGKKKK